MKKRFLCILLSMCMMFSFASYSVKAEGDDKEAVISAMIDILPVKELYGLENVDFSTLEMGNKINVYNYVENAFVFSRAAYPIFGGGELIAVLYEVGASQFQLMDGIAEAIRVANCTDIAIVYARAGCYVFDGERFILIREARDQDTSKSILPVDISTINTSSVSITNLSGVTELDLASVPAICSDESYSLNVPYVSQGNTEYMGWAAAIASVANYKNGTNYSYTDIAIARRGTAIDAFVDTPDVATYLRYYCPTYYMRNSNVTYANIVSNLQSGHPVIGVFNKEVGLLQDTVIRGNTSSGSLYVMDPARGWMTAIYDSTMGYYYICPATNIVLRLQRAISIVWPY